MNTTEKHRLSIAILGERIKEVIMIDKMKCEGRWTKEHEKALDEEIRARAVQEFLTKFSNSERQAVLNRAPTNTQADMDVDPQSNMINLNKRYVTHYDKHYNAIM